MASTGYALQQIRKLLEGDVKERPAATVAQRRRFLQSASGKALNDSTVMRLLKMRGFSQKNEPWGRWNGTSGSELPGECRWQKR